MKVVSWRPQNGCAPWAPMENCTWRRSSLTLRAVAVADAASLRAQLAELGRPEGERGGGAAVVEPAIVRVIGCVETDAGEPALGELVVGRGVEAEGASSLPAGGRRRRSLRLMKRAVEPALQRLLAIGEVEAAKLAGPAVSGAVPRAKLAPISRFECSESRGTSSGGRDRRGRCGSAIRTRLRRFRCRPHRSLRRRGCGGSERCG